MSDDAWRAEAAERIVGETRALVSEIAREVSRKAPGFLLGPELERGLAAWTLLRSMADATDDAPSHFSRMVGLLSRALVAVVEERYPWPGQRSRTETKP